MSDDPWLWRCVVCGLAAVREGEHSYTLDGTPTVCPGGPRPAGPDGDTVSDDDLT